MVCKSSIRPHKDVPRSCSSFCVSVRLFIERDPNMCLCPMKVKSEGKGAVKGVKVRDENFGHNLRGVWSRRENRGDSGL